MEGTITDRDLHTARSSLMLKRTMSFLIYFGEMRGRLISGAKHCSRVLGLPHVMQGTGCIRLVNLPEAENLRMGAEMANLVIETGRWEEPDQGARRLGAEAPSQGLMKINRIERATNS